MKLFLIKFRIYNLLEVLNIFNLDLSDRQSSHNNEIFSRCNARQINTLS